MIHITALLQKIKQGDAAAESHLIPLIYNELRAILARNHMGRERPDHTLQATVLVHDVFLQLVGNPQIDWRNRAHFFALASRVMRHILVDHAQQPGAEASWVQAEVELEAALVFVEGQHDDFLALDEALQRLAEWDPRQSRVIEMHFFGGLGFEQIAEVLGISTAPPYGIGRWRAPGYTGS